jgi:hypothetical protein
MNHSPIISYFGGRKFIVALLLIASATTLGMFDKMDSGAIGIVLALVGAGYGFSNVMGKKNETSDPDSGSVVVRSDT